jgi:hypothetical protein
LAVLPPLAAQSGPGDTAQLRKEIAGLEEDMLRAEAKLQALESERKLLRRADVPPPPGAKAGNLADPETVLNQLRQDLKATHDKRREALDRLVSKSNSDSEQAIESLNKAREQAFLVHKDLTDTQARLGPASKNRYIDTGLVCIFLWGGLVLAAGILLGMHVLRVGLRQRWRSGLVASVLFALAIASPALAELPEPQVLTDPKALADERDGLKVALDQLKGKANTIEQEIKRDRAKRLRAWEEMLAEPKNKLKLDETFVQWENDAYDHLHKVLVNAYLTKRALDRAQKFLALAAADRATLSDLVSSDHSHNRVKRSIKFGACIAFPLLALFPVYRARKKARKRLAQEAGSCPCCLAVGCLEEKVATVQDERYPEPRYYSCPQCSYEFRASYRKLPRLCFPTVGVPASGKTHWLVSAYDLVKNNNTGYGVDSAIQRAPSLADDTFDALIEVVLESHQKPQATTHGHLPSPLTFHITDVDPLGRSRALLNLFDCSGEIMYTNINTDVVRRRALLMDGFFLFLDPTQVSRHGPMPGLDAQINRLANFHAEMRDIRGLDVGDRIDVPIAVCVSKLDLLVTKNPLRGQSRPLLSKLRDTIGAPPTLEMLKYRSELVEDVLPVMFMGWDVIKTLRENFGRRYLFFPMTPVGIEESELGIEDLRQRNISPIGILEPVLWLIHMRGYCVLPSSTAKGGS